MENKDIMIGFILLVAVILTISLNEWCGVIVDLFILSAYYLMRYMYIAYKGESYISRDNMKPAYSFLVLGTLFFGIMRVIHTYSKLFSSSTMYSSMSSPLKLAFYVDVLFALVFIYLLIKFIFNDLLDFSITTSYPSTQESKGGDEEIKILEEEKKDEDIEEERKEERGVKKLPVIIVSKK